LSKKQKLAKIGSMKELQPLTIEEIHTAYDEGEAEVLALIVGWTNRLMARVEQQTELVQRLQAEVKALEGQIAKNSRNSGKPPSSDSYNRPAPKSLRKRHGKKSGGQVGHVG